MQTLRLPKKVACVGSGIIGSSWALLFAMKGLHVTVYDSDVSSLDRSTGNLKRMLATLAENGALASSSFLPVLSRIVNTPKISDISEAEYVQESVNEELKTKVRVLREIEEVVSPSTVIASSTSGLSITAMQRRLEHPERSLIAHPFNPPYLIPLVEIVPSRKTSEATVQFTHRFMKSLGKEPILIKKQLPGFAANRIQAAIFREVLNLLNDDVVGMEDLEKVFTAGLGIRLSTVGQFTLFSLAAGPGGLDTYFERYGLHSRDMLKTMSNWTVPPKSARAKAVAAEKGLEMLQKGYEEAMKWRDARLIKVMKALGYFS